MATMVQKWKEFDNAPYSVSIGKCTVKYKQLLISWCNYVIHDKSVKFDKTMEFIGMHDSKDLF